LTKKIKMGWLFGRKKKVPKIPLPQGHVFNEKTLQFPTALSTDKIIEPEDVKEAVGIEQPEQSLAQEVPIPQPEPKNLLEETSPLYTEEPQTRIINNQPEEPIYVRVNVYQRMLGELDNLKQNLADMHIAQQTLETSEYNEEHNFDKLRISVKSMHDRLLQVDKILFKN
jgi:hypothetical protein